MCGVQTMECSSSFSVSIADLLSELTQLQQQLGQFSSFSWRHSCLATATSPELDKQFIHSASAFVAFHSNQLTASLLAECRVFVDHRQKPLSLDIHLLCETLFVPPTFALVTGRPAAHLCRFAAQRPGPVRKQFSAHHVRRGRQKPGWTISTTSWHHITIFGWLVAWHSGRTSVFGRRTFPALRSTCIWRVAIMWVYTVHYRSTNQSNSAFHLFGVDRWIVSCNWMSLTSTRGGVIWWTRTKERQAWCICR